MKYKGFVINFDEYVPRIYAYNKNLDKSFSFGMTEIQKSAYEKMFGYIGYKLILTNNIKQLIDNYCTYNNL